MRDGITYWIGKDGHRLWLVFDDDVLEADLSSWEAARPAIERAVHAIGILHASPKGGLGYTTFYKQERTYGQAETVERGVESIRQAREQLRAEERREQDPTYLLEKLLKTHDWYAHYSDDYGVVCASDRHWDRIRALLPQVPKDVGDALVARYRPKAAG